MPSQYALIGDVRSRGVIIGVELAKDDAKILAVGEATTIEKSLEEL